MLTRHFFENAQGCAIIVDMSEKRSKNSGSLLGVGLSILLAAGAFFSGLGIGAHQSASSSMEANIFSFFWHRDTETSSEANLSEFWRVWNLLNEKFVSSTTTESITDEQKVEGAISGLVHSYGDPYTVFFPPAEAEEFAEDISGNFSGVGMEVGMRDNLITVIAPLPDTPAEKAGLKSGDVIVEIDGKKTDDMSIDEAVKLIRGEQGTVVKLNIYRKGDSDFREISVTRDVIAIPTLKTEIKDDVFIIRLYSFNALAADKMRLAMEEYKDGGYEKLVLDLRGNPGGYLQGAVNIASHFLPSGSVVVRESFGGDQEEQVYRSQGESGLDFNPDNFVVLVDGGSASASEILAGALSEHKVATTLGTKTFGKGSVQELVNLPDGASLKVTVARWLTPNGVSFSQNGLEPEVKLTPSEEDIKDNKDVQQAAALKWLSGDHTVGDADLMSMLSGEEGGN